jgi:phage gp36-like protein
MRYCSVADVRIALTQAGSATGSNTAADMDDVTISDSIYEASGVIDGYIGGSYQPSDTVPPIVTFWCRDVAAFLATCTWRKSKDFAAMDPVWLRYQWVLGQLNGLGAGSIVLPGGGPSNPTGSSGATVVNPYPCTLFTPCDFDLLGESEGASPVGAVNQWWGYAGS